MRSLLLSVVFGCLAGACGGAQTEPEEPSSPCEPTGPFGEPSAFSLAETSLGDVAVGAVQACSDGHYVRLARAEGAYPLVLGRGDDRCEGPPSASPGCEAIRADALLHALHEQLQAEGIETIGIGLGPCGQVGDDYDAWNLSFAVNEWQHTDEVARRLAAMMTEWDAVGHVGVAVRAIPCGVALEGE